MKSNYKIIFLITSLTSYSLSESFSNLTHLDGTTSTYKTCFVVGHDVGPLSRYWVDEAVLRLEACVGFIPNLLRSSMLNWSPKSFYWKNPQATNHIWKMKGSVHLHHPHRRSVIPFEGIVDSWYFGIFDDDLLCSIYVNELKARGLAAAAPRAVCFDIWETHDNSLSSRHFFLYKTFNFYEKLYFYTKTYFFAKYLCKTMEMCENIFLFL